MLDLSHRPELATLSSLVQAFRTHGGVDDLLLVGATARDVLMGFQYGIPVTRATKDVDFAVAVQDWPTYLRLREALLASGQFEGRGDSLHALTFRSMCAVDLVPFGGVLRPDWTIAWPPNQDPVMTLLAYPEAWKTSLPVRLPMGQELQVISIPSMAILKLVAWKDRRHYSRGKDADDLWLLLRNYLEAGQMDRLYEEASLLFEQPDFDLDRAGSWLLGKDAGWVLDQGDQPRATREFVYKLLEPELDPDGALHLARDLRPEKIEAGLELLTAFHAGLVGKPNPSMG